MGSFGQVISIPNPNLGFLGDMTRVGGGDPYAVSHQVDANVSVSINFGDAVVLLPNNTGGTYKQFADWIANGGNGSGFTVSTTLASSTTATPASLQGLSIGMFVQGTGINAGTYITAISQSAGTITLSKAATVSSAENLNYALFAGFAVREVVTQQPYSSYSPSAGGETGNFGAGSFCGAIQRGGVLVSLKNGTPQAGFAAYIRAILNSGTYPNGIVGGIESITDTVNNIYLGNGSNIAQVFFTTGTVDANSLAELAILTRIQV